MSYGEREDQTVPGEVGNPYLDAYERWRTTPHDPEVREDLIRTFGFAIPSAEALLLIAVHSPAGVIEIGAGTGYWARLLADRGVDVVAFDIAPPPSEDNFWFAGEEPWFPVAAGDHHVVEYFADRTLLLVWPTRNEDWAADAAQRYLEAGGQRLVYVGEPPGGRTGDLRLHALLDLVGPCLACAYGVTNAPCTCAVTVRWRRLAELPLPRWDDREDRMYVFGPPGQGRPSRRWTRRFRPRPAA